MLAPMEDVTDISFRLMCKQFGADMVYTEFVSSDALIRQVSKTEEKLKVSDEERPVAIQIYGREVMPMVEAAQICEAAHPDMLDINFGCPVKKVANKGAGAGMLRNLPLMLEITRAVVKAVNIPVTAGMPIIALSSNWPSSCRTAALQPSRSTDAHVHKCTPARPTGRSSAP